jgi:selenium-binding protein 1
MKKISKLALALLVFSTLLIIPTYAAGRNQGFIHGIVITIDEVDYYLAGAPDGPGGAVDVPGHYWILVGPNKLVGKHYNTGPFGAPSFWSSDAPDGELLYVVKAIIDEWTPEKAAYYSSRGFTHYHELITVIGGTPHPTLVVWLKHIARTSFILDGGPAPAFAHDVTPGIDFEFIPNWTNPYSP